MSKTVVATASDSIISLAQAAGFADWHVIYDAPENAALKKKRPDPGVLQAGDQVFLPDFDALTVTLKAPGTYTIHTKSIYAEVHMLLSDPAGKPYANKNWELKVGDRIFKGRTDAQGTVKQKVPATATSGELTVFLDAKGEHKVSWEVAIGGLDPIDSDAGVQGRLNNLGYNTGADEHGKIGKGTQRAIRDFQNDHGLPVTGKVDAATRAKLERASTRERPPTTPHSAPAARRANLRRTVHAAHIQRAQQQLRSGCGQDAGRCDRQTAWSGDPRRARIQMGEGDVNKRYAALLSDIKKKRADHTGIHGLKHDLALYGKDVAEEVVLFVIEQALVIAQTDAGFKSQDQHHRRR